MGASGELTGRVLLLGQEVAVVVEADSGVHGESVVEPPCVLRIQAQRVEAVFGFRRLEEHHFGRRAAAKHVQHVVVRSGEPLRRARLAEPFPADLEVVISRQIVLEVAERSENLRALDVELSRAGSPRDDAGVQVLIADAGAVRRVRPAVAELPRADFQVRRWRNHRVPFGLPQKRAVVLAEARVVGQMDRRGAAEQLPVEPRCSALSCSAGSSR